MTNVEEEFLRYLPRCDGCGEFLPPGGKSTDLVILSYVEDHRGRRQVVESSMYHKACAPKKPNGEEYPAGAITFIHREQPL